MKVTINKTEWTRLLSGVFVGVRENGKIEVLTQKEFNKLYSHNVWWSKIKREIRILLKFFYLFLKMELIKKRIEYLKNQMQEIKNELIQLNEIKKKLNENKIT